MAVLAIRTSSWANAVSRLHGQISRHMWQNIWPGMPQQEVPIGHVTNGVHARSWLSASLIDLLDRYLGAKRWQNDPTDQSVWASINEVPDEELWRLHEQRRHRLIVWASRRLREQMEDRGADADEIRRAAESLNPNALTIGFARRFATYKRGNMILRDAERLMAICANRQRPVQFIIAGKAHPVDTAGKDLIRQIIQIAGSQEAGRHIVFLENYDINVARYLVQGCDLWLNTPRRGMEASGTSGMKAAINGVLNCSVLDGWWDEAYHSSLGWAIGRGETYTNYDLQDDVESRALYDLLEKQIIPLFYDRNDYGVPRQWVARMKRCISTLAPLFNANRMVREYTENYYFPAFARTRMLGENDLAKAIDLAHQKERLRVAWPTLSVVEVQANTNGPLDVNQKLTVSVVVGLAGLDPVEVRVQIYMGHLDNDGRINDGQAYDLTDVESVGEDRHRFCGAFEPGTSGRHGFAIRIIPGGPVFDGTAEPGLIFWDRSAEASPQPAHAEAGAPS